ncbi:MAG: helix-turn-helix transcriptional regulator [Oscillospiraceae bacterium]|nr:helix-turn-helix transcriptional regulator [Oscillospiraceae bacterium]
MDLLIKRNRTRYWLVKELQTDYNSINKICNNEVTSLHLETIEKLCCALECTPDELFLFE